MTNPRDLAPTGDTALPVDLDALVALDLHELRELWVQRYGPAPPLRSPNFLRRLLAWRIQSERHGGLDGQVLKVVSAPTPPKVRRAQVRDGVRLSREWQGRTYEVEAADGGYVCDGARYASLSEAARAITGVRWNGPRFFGLREKAD